MMYELVVWFGMFLGIPSSKMVLEYQTLEECEQGKQQFVDNENVSLLFCKAVPEEE